MDFCATIGAEIDHRLERAAAEANESSHSSRMSGQSFSPSSPDYSPRSPSPNFSFKLIDKASIDSFMEEEGETANILGRFHLDNDSSDHNEYRPRDVTYDTSANRDDTLQRGIVMPHIPFETSMAEMERIGCEELDAIRNNIWRNMVVLPPEISPFAFQPNLPLDYWVCRCRFTVGSPHCHLCRFCEYCSTQTHEWNDPWDMHHPGWTQQQWDEREEWLFW